MFTLTNPDAVGVIADVAGLELTVSDREFLLQPELCGLILFARNYQDPQQLTELTTSILAIRPDLVLCADQEGGRVQRFREGFTRLPPMLALAQYYQQNPQDAVLLSHELGWLMASEIRACHVHLSFAPVLDLDYGCSSVIGNRAFGHNSEEVIVLAGAFIAGMAEADMLAVGKHFPGHGAVRGDSHLTLPVDERSWEQLQHDIAPFSHFIQHRQLAGIMPAHVRYPQIDAQHNAGFSVRWLQQILRQRLGFAGVIFSDDLSMEGAAVASGYSLRALAAIDAGANALLVCNQREAAQEVIECVRTAGRPALDLSAWQGAMPVPNATRQQAVVRQLQKLL